MAEITRKTLRELDDVSCANVVTTRSIRKLIKKYPNFNSIAMDCWSNGHHYTKFVNADNKFKWYTDGIDGFIERDCNSDGSWEPIDKEALNKLIVYTYRTMCDSIGSDVEFVDTPEDILAYAEQKLKEMLSDTSA